MIKKIDVSFVIPCYRSENTIQAVVDEIEHTMAGRHELSYEIILVNDGSPDKVWDVIQALCLNDDKIIGVNLAKNFGQHCALMAGYHQALGEYIVSLDDDGQTPAQEVFQLLDKLGEGYDVVYASYPEQHKSIIRRWGSSFTQKMTHYMLDVHEDYPKGSSYFVMKKYIRDEIIRYEHPYPFLPGLIFRVTRSICMIPINQRQRLQGKSGYSLKSLFSLWLNGFTAFSVKPLEFGAVLGFIFATIGFMFAICVIISKLLHPEIQAGWSSIISLMMILGGVIMIMLGLIGEYIGRIYICLNKSPQFVVKDVIGNNLR